MLMNFNSLVWYCLWFKTVFEKYVIQWIWDIKSKRYTTQLDFHIQCRKVGTQNITTFLRFRANTKYKAVVIDDVKCV